MDFIDKLIKLTSKDQRTIIGKLKSIDYLGNIYLVNCVEVFDKHSDYYTPFEIFENNEDTNLNFETENNSYQLIGSMLVEKVDVSKLEICN